MQSNYVYDVDNNLLVDFIGKLENFEQDVNQIKKRLGIDFPLLHLNTTNHNSNNSMLSLSAKDLITELWAIDFNNFDYSVN
ncbi:hypothetical protein VKI21_03665 [Cyanobacterium aponinum UTEX 3222]|uniref:hypothetical protein n=1 Tax=Cyanobacterium aponinum TaxID=379064 RepID=UPI00309304F9|nr:hypothetical protein VKI21_03665 [Cyanobacterium aponinum UTEX 3222]